MTATDKLLIVQIHRLMKEIRQATPKPPTSDWRKPADLILRDDYLKGQKVKAASLTLLPSGCQYAVQGGCTICGEWAGSNHGDLVPAQFHVAQFASACAGLFFDKQIDWLRIYQEGSFLNPQEVAPDARDVILRLAASLNGVSRITIESRPEYLVDQIARVLKSHTQRVELEIGVGLESKNNFVRNVCIGKGTHLDVYERVVNIAHANDLFILAYVLLKPPFLSENESIEDTVQTVRFAFDVGFDGVYIQIASIHEWSLLELLMLNSCYTLPWLWSIIEVVKRTAGFGEIRIGGLEYFPRPALVAQNYSDKLRKVPCSCSQNVWEAIQAYNATGSLDVFDSLSCNCQNIWRSELAAPFSRLTERVSETLKKISVQNYLNAKMDRLAKL